MALMGAIAIGLSFTRMNAAELFRNCALVQAFPVVIGVVLSSLQEKQLSLWYTRYGAFFSWFTFMAIVAQGLSLNRDQPFAAQFVEKREQIGLQDIG